MKHRRRRKSNSSSELAGRVVLITLGGKSGLVATIDADDWPLVANYTWTPQTLGYAATTARTADGKRTTLLLHRVILGITDRKISVDHINRDRLDCRRANLRIITQAQNCQNRGLNKNNTSGFRGVSWNKTKKRWSAHVWLRGKSHSLGFFDTAQLAAEAASAWRAEHMTHSDDLPRTWASGLLL
jgi:hypothetical protein